MQTGLSKLIEYLDNEIAESNGLNATIAYERCRVKAVQLIEAEKKQTDSTIQFDIKLNAGKQKGKTVFVQTDIEELQEEDLSAILIRHGYLEAWCNKDEYTVLKSEFI